MDRHFESKLSCANGDYKISRFATPGWPRRWMAVLVTAPLFALGAYAQADHTNRPVEQDATPRGTQSGYVVVPDSSKDQGPGRAHTNYVLRSLDGVHAVVIKPGSEAEAVANPDSTVELAETPNSMGCLYVSSPSSAGCVPKGLTQTGGPSSAGYGAIALVDAFDNPDAASDLATFDSNFGLAAATFVKVYANGNGDCSTPPANSGWSVESSLDIEWAHVFAPKAAIILVEACSNSNTDLFYAEQVAFNYIVDNYPTGGQVSNSWGEGEFSGETSNDVYFSDLEYSGATGWKTHVLGFASAGDGGAAANYPSVVPWLVSAGGTSILRNSTNDYFSSESCWADSGGGTSTYETYATSYTGSNMGPWADYQYPIFGQAARSVPDMSFNADPSSGVYIYSKYGVGGWTPVGGTSVSSPSLASIVNRAGNELSSYHIYPLTDNGYFTNEENNLIYAEAAGVHTYADFYDVKTGSNGHTAVVNYDQCTGNGSPRGIVGK